MAATLPGLAYRLDKLSYMLRAWREEVKAPELTELQEEDVDRLESEIDNLYQVIKELDTLMIETEDFVKE